MNREDQRLALIRSCLSGAAHRPPAYGTVEMANRAIEIADAVLAVLEKRHDTIPCAPTSWPDDDRTHSEIVLPRTFVSLHEDEEEASSRTRRMLTNLEATTENMLHSAGCRLEGSR